MSHEPTREGHIVGIDLGVASIGWNLVGIDPDGRPGAILATGSHTFDPGVEGDIASGRDEARGAARRNARMARKMLERRQRRRRKILGLLQRARLLPPGDIKSPQAIHDYLLALDANLRNRLSTKGNRASEHTWLYRLRAAALDRKLEPDELGRALYHLAQRRGFLSNRKSLKKDEDDGVVKQGISDLARAMGSRTLGQYFAELDPEAERIRKRWTSRQMYVDEFNRICDVQGSHHPTIFTTEFRKSLDRAVFFQRPMKSSKRLIGKCELVPGARRAAVADRLVQRFRILQKVNDLRIFPPAGSPRPLSTDERQKLLKALFRDGDKTFAAIKSKKVLGLPKGTTFNFEQDDDEKRLPGHRTDEKMRAAFGDAWDQMDESRRDEIVLEVLSFQDPDALMRRAIKAWQLGEQAARALADTRLEQGYAAHSRKALRKLVGRMEDGTQYATARKELFPERFIAAESMDRLPPIEKAVPSLRNPAVSRALTELRKLMNELIRVHGKPVVIRIELARDLKRSRKERERKSREIDEQAKLRIAAKKKLLSEAGVQEARRSDIEKALLWEECRGVCPYTGRSIDFSALFGKNPQFDVEHIIPFSRSLDNSFLNKTLCYHKENRDHKRNQTPYEAYHRNPDQYEEILGRVRGFAGKGVQAKLRRFEMQSLPEDFVSRQLNDTRYASRLAGDYLALLYGGRVDAGGTQRIQISSGGITAHLRNEWMLNSILGQGEKNRDDHRHHAVDALAVALAEPAIIQKLQRAAERASEEGRRLFAPVPEPWPGFLEEARKAVNAINVSSRQNKKIVGGLHQDTNYSKDYIRLDKKGKPNEVRHVRKPVESLSESAVDDIVDPIIREKVRAWLKSFAKPKAGASIKYPTIRAHDGREIPIKTVRIRVAIAVVPVGNERDPDGKEISGPRTRYVKPGSNHHAVIVAVLDKEGNEIAWEDYVVTRLEAHQRKAAGQPIIQREWGPGRKFKFSLSAKDYLLVKQASNGERLIKLLSVSEGTYEFRDHRDARMASEARVQGSGARIRLSAEIMRKQRARKVRVGYLGNIVVSND